MLCRRLFEGILDKQDRLAVTDAHRRGHAPRGGVPWLARSFSSVSTRLRGRTKRTRSRTVAVASGTRPPCPRRRGLHPGGLGQTRFLSKHALSCSRLVHLLSGGGVPRAAAPLGLPHGPSPVTPVPARSTPAPGLARLRRRGGPQPRPSCCAQQTPRVALPVDATCAVRCPEMVKPSERRSSRLGSKPSVDYR